MSWKKYHEELLSTHAWWSIYSLYTAKKLLKFSAVGHLIIRSGMAIFSRIKITIKVPSLLLLLRSKWLSKILLVFCAHLYVHLYQQLSWADLLVMWKPQVFGLFLRFWASEVFWKWKICFGRAVRWVIMYLWEPKHWGVFISDVRTSGFWASGELRPRKIDFGWTGGPRLGLDTSL